MTKFYEKNYKELLVSKGKEQDQNILFVTLNSPENANALSSAMIKSLKEVLENAEYDKDIRVIIVKGEGKFFCAGGNIKDMVEKKGIFKGDSNTLRINYQRDIQTIPRTIEALTKPVIAQINGAAIGAGFDLTLMCDLRVSLKTASVGQTFNKISLIPGDGGAYFLTRIVGYAKACEMLLTGRIYKARDLETFGVFTDLCDNENELTDKTLKLAREISQNSPIAISLGKQLLKHALRGELSHHLDMAASFQSITQRTSDHFEGLKAFNEKRAPKFLGK